jgi:hypothetical protein
MLVIRAHARQGISLDVADFCSWFAALSNTKLCEPKEGYLGKKDRMGPLPPNGRENTHASWWGTIRCTDPPQTQPKPAPSHDRETDRASGATTPPPAGQKLEEQLRLSWWNVKKKVEKSQKNFDTGHRGDCFSLLRLLHMDDSLP